MIGFVTWPPFFIPKCYKGDQVTKTIILVKYYASYKLFQVVEIGKVTSWPQLMSEFLVAHAC